MDRAARWLTTLPRRGAFFVSILVTAATGEASSSVNVYELRANPDGFLQLTLVRESDAIVLDELRGHPVGRAWEPLEVETVEEGPKADFEFVPAG